ncbi:MAG TPA: hypothetical protein GX729_04110 [Firmicutes bacterium]|jgi:hypothetical protein|nr:hypothetical protein [Bacillota bacterium]
MKKNTRSKPNPQIILVALTSIYIAGSLFGVNRYRDRLERSETEAIIRSIERAAVQCYALEGHYPPDLKYLEHNYGIRIDEDKYHYEYSVFASNIRPYINVIKKVDSK